ncbi:hydantoinase/oxoprolinase family protein [Xanthobacter sp. KR7-225]|uniref:hydantoinase/oxoprolinase family protein n=1 Tax=Xanthobacter sp. KR7-225 TaxID=3156613 RepID=UPI0032B439E9
MSRIGWDVGGAHLKRAVLGANGRLARVDIAPCALWQGLDRLEAALAGLPPVPDARSVVTMTGELVDLWPDRATGVAALGAALAARLGAGTLFYAGPSGFVGAADLAAYAGAIASANWHATAQALARLVPAGLLADMGSTTTDLVPFADGAVRALAYTDAARLVAGELVYTGIARTSVMALAPALPFRGAWVPLMAEHFATTADVWRLLGELPEGADLHPAADGGAKTEEASARRLLRMVGQDLAPDGIEEARALAAATAEAQFALLARGLERVLAASGLPQDAPLLGAGVGRGLMARLAARAGRPYLDAGALLAGGAAFAGAAADCAPAVAVARLALS